MRRAVPPESLRGPVSNRDREETLKLDKIHTKFVFFKASPDESTVGVVYSFLAGTMRCRMSLRNPFGAKLDKTRPKFCILKFLPDEGHKSPCGIIAAPKPAAGGAADRYGGGIVIAPEYKPIAAACRSPGARKVVASCWFLAVRPQRGEEKKYVNRQGLSLAKTKERQFSSHFLGDTAPNL